MSAQVERLMKARTIRMTVVAVVQMISRRELPSIYSALRPGRVRYRIMKVTIAAMTRTQTTITSQKMISKSRSIFGPKVEISCGKYMCSSIEALPLRYQLAIAERAVAAPIRAADTTLQCL